MFNVPMSPVVLVLSLATIGCKPFVRLSSICTSVIFRTCLLLE